MSVAVECLAPLPGVNTEPVPQQLNAGLKYLQMYTYHCLEGYATSDVVTTICLEDGNLSLAAPPECFGKLVILIKYFINMLSFQ